MYRHHRCKPFTIVEVCRGLISLYRQKCPLNTIAPFLTSTLNAKSALQEPRWPPYSFRGAFAGHRRPHLDAEHLYGSTIVPPITAIYTTLAYRLTSSTNAFPFIVLVAFVLNQVHTSMLATKIKHSLSLTAVDQRSGGCRDRLLLNSIKPSPVKCSTTNHLLATLEMGSIDRIKKEYDHVANAYKGGLSLPGGVLDSQLIAAALGHNCTGLTVLDLGGGFGTHGREAVDLGAVAVDVVDLSAGMLRVGAKMDAAHPCHRPGVIHFLQADCGQPLTHLPLRPEDYDVVMANWLFCHAETRTALAGKFRNIAAHPKSGGRLVNICEGGAARPRRALGQVRDQVHEPVRHPGRR